MSFFAKLRGTIETIFQIGLGGPNIKANAGAVEMRNAADAGFAITRGADPVGANDYVTKGSLTSGAPQISLSAAGGWASLTNGASAIVQIESTMNLVNSFVVDFLTAVQSFFEWDFAMPSDWDGGTITAVFYWIANSASANSAVWGFQGRAYADANALDGAFGAAVEVTDANNGTNLVNQSAATGAITIAGSPGASRHVQFRAYRLGSGADNLAATARLLEVRLTYGRS